MRDNARLLMKLLGEEVDTKVAVLAGLSRGGDADDLARPVLEDHQVTNADVVARDGEGRGLGLVDRGDGSGGLVGRGALVGHIRDRLVVVVGLHTLGGGLVVVGVVLRHLDGGLGLVGVG